MYVSYEPLTSRFLRLVGTMILCGFSFWLSGCAAEEGNKIAVEKIGTGVPTQELFTQYPIDGRGYVNGTYIPITNPKFQGFYPISYVGSWTVKQTGTGQQLFSAIGERRGDRVTIVGSFTRVIFEFHDYEMYPNPGNVSFFKDGESIGSFDLDRKDGRGDKINNFQLSNLEGKMATYSMVLNSGQVVITGYGLTYP